MKNKICSKLFLTFALILVIYPAFQVQAKVENFTDMYMDLNVPEDTIILTKDTPDTDAKWKEAGITNPKNEKDNFDDIGVQALLYDPSTKTTVSLLQKHSSDSKNIFNLSLLSEKDLSKFLNDLVTTNDKNAKTSIEKYEQNETTFFHYVINTTKNDTPLTEIIYGTIVNGMTITFDIYKENSTKPIDESFIKELVAGTHFTQIFDKAEVKKQERDSTIRLIITFGILAAVIAVWVMLRKNKAKKLQAIKKSKAEALTQFYKLQKQNEEQNIIEPKLFLNHTMYSEEVFKTFCFYNEIIKKYQVWIISALLYIAILVILYTASSSIISFSIAIVILFIFIYYQGIRIEKLVNRMIKSYDITKSKEAIFTFYDDYYTLSGVQSTSKYPYLLISDVKVYKEYIYIYLGTDKAFYLKKDGFEKDLDGFMNFIKQRTK